MRGRWAGRRLDERTPRETRSRRKLPKRVVRTLRGPRERLANLYAAKEADLPDALEGFDDKAIVETRKSRGFRTFHAARQALVDTPGHLPEPESPTDSAEEAARLRRITTLRANSTTQPARWYAPSNKPSASSLSDSASRIATRSLNCSSVVFTAAGFCGWPVDIDAPLG
jgi:hypothetical protein